MPPFSDLPGIVHLCVQLVELLVPAIIMLLIAAIKGVIEVDEFEAFIPDADVPVVSYEAIQNTTSYPNVLCHDNNAFFRCVPQVTPGRTPLLKICSLTFSLRC